MVGPSLPTVDQRAGFASTYPLSPNAAKDQGSATNDDFLRVTIPR